MTLDLSLEEKLFMVLAFFTNKNNSNSAIPCLKNDSLENLSAKILFLVSNTPQKWFR